MTQDTRYEGYDIDKRKKLDRCTRWDVEKGNGWHVVTSGSDDPAQHESRAQPVQAGSTRQRPHTKVAVKSVTTG